MRNLNNLDTSVLTLSQIQAFQDFLPSLVPAECAIASLVKAFNECDIKSCNFIAQSEVDVSVRPWVSRTEAERASVQWPS